MQGTLTLGICSSTVLDFMRKLILLSSLALAFAVPLASTTHAAVIYRAGEGWTADTVDSGPAEKTASEQLHKAEALEAKGELKKAIGAYRVLIRKFPDSGIGPKVALKLAQLCEATKEPERAFDAYGKYISRFPRGDDFDTCVEAQFRIAKLFLNGERRKLFGMKTFGSIERAQQMFEEIVKNAPFSRWAALAQFNLGQALEKQKKFPEAIVAYQQVVDKYSTDQIAGDAQYQIGYIYLQDTKHGANDRGARDKARDAFEDFSIKYPQSEKVAQAQDNIKQLSDVNLKKTLGVAQFYERTKNFKAAAVYYQDVVKQGTGSPEAAIAKTQLDHLKTTVGEAVLHLDSEKSGKAHGPAAEMRKKAQARAETASRPDFVGPPAPAVPDEVAPPQPKMRTSGGAGPTALEMPAGEAPAVSEPALPSH